MGTLQLGAWRGPRRARRGPRLLTLLLAWCGCAVGATEVPTVSGPVPVTAATRPYGAAVVPGAPESMDLESAGYVEAEFFVSGHASAYAYDPAFNLISQRERIAYTTRILVRRPRNARRFSGVVVLESAHPLMGGHGGWLAAQRYLLSHGDAYVVVMTGDDALTRGAALAPERAALVQRTRAAGAALGVIEAMRLVDPARYAPIVWPDDDAPRWDAIAQVAALLKANLPGGPMGGLRVRRIYAQGWSFTGSLLRTFINEGFHDRARDASGRPLIDGYLVGISAAPFISGMVPLTTGAPVLPVGHPRRTTRAIDVPVIELMTENEAITNLGPQATDADRGIGRHRIYEVPGLTHGDGLAAPGESSTMRYQLQQAGFHATQTSGCTLEASDVPMRDLASAALANLELWVTRGTPAPASLRLDMADGGNRPRRDSLGNALGGVRVAQVEVPLAHYTVPGPDASEACRNEPSPFLKIRRQPLADTELADRYRDADEYLRRFRSQVNGLVRQRLLLPEDGRREIQDAQRRATAAFGGR